MKACKTQLRQQLLEENNYARLTFCHQFSEKLGNDDAFVSSLLVSNEATFHISGKVNRHYIIAEFGELKTQMKLLSMRETLLKFMCGVLCEKIGS